jgi:hypothetical protein
MRDLEASALPHAREARLDRANQAPPQICAKVPSSSASLLHPSVESDQPNLCKPKML